MAVKVFTIGDLAKRTGLSVSAIRFYEEKGLIIPHRSNGGQRRYMGPDIRRLSFVMIAQKMGFSLQDIVAQLKKLPAGRTPTKQDWARISKGFRKDIDNRLAELKRMRDNLDGCIGCGCLSLEACKLYNPGDKLAAQGPGPRTILRKNA